MNGFIWNAVLIAALVVLFYSLFNLARIYLEYKEGTDEYEELRQYAAVVSPESEAEEEPSPTDWSEPEPISDSKEEEAKEEEAQEVMEPPLTVDFASLREINPDVKGWLYMEALDISYPIVQGADNDEYLHRTYEGTENFAGSIFMDYQNSGNFEDHHTIIYGHNMKNQSMFGKLKLFVEQEKYRDSIYFWILTPERNYRYQIYTAFYTEADSEVYTFYTDGGENFAGYAGRMALASAVPLDKPDFTGEEKVVTLSTCASRDSSGRFVVQGLRLN